MAERLTILPKTMTASLVCPEHGLCAIEDRDSRARRREEVGISRTRDKREH